MLQHTLIPSECEHSLIQDLAESGDNEYYLSALRPPIGDFDRAMRGRKRILKNIEKLEALIKKIKCPACHYIILEQIKSHTQAIEEIDNAWKPKQRNEQ